MWGEKRDESKGLKMWESAAAKGNVSAIVSQYVCIALGLGGAAKNEEQA
jgi:hypothetical protein